MTTTYTFMYFVLQLLSTGYNVEMNTLLSAVEFQYLPLLVIIIMSQNNVTNIYIPILFYSRG